MIVASPRIFLDVVFSLELKMLVFGTVVLLVIRFSRKPRLIKPASGGEIVLRDLLGLARDLDIAIVCERDLIASCSAQRFCVGQVNAHASKLRHHVSLD